MSADFRRKTDEPKPIVIGAPAYRNGVASDPGARNAARHRMSTGRRPDSPVGGNLLKYRPGDTQRRLSPLSAPGHAATDDSSLPISNACAADVLVVRGSACRGGLQRTRTGSSDLAKRLT